MHPEAMIFIKDAGYQVLDLAHNHILDSQIDVVQQQMLLRRQEMTPHESRDQAPPVIKEVTGNIRYLLAYSGFNGIEQSNFQEDYNRYLRSKMKMKAEIERAEKEVGYYHYHASNGGARLEPTEEQKALITR